MPADGIPGPPSPSLSPPPKVPRGYPPCKHNRHANPYHLADAHIPKAAAAVAAAVASAVEPSRRA